MMVTDANPFLGQAELHLCHNHFAVFSCARTWTFLKLVTFKRHADLSVEYQEVTQVHSHLKAFIRHHASGLFCSDLSPNMENGLVVYVHSGAPL